MLNQSNNNSAFRIPHSAFLSLYIHIPFCLRKCRYCDFYSVPVDDSSIFDNYINALIKEWEIYEDSGILDNASIYTIFIGGGTPSILDVDTWKRLDGALFSRIGKAGIREWSVECNPESFTMEKAQAYADSGVTRLTFGVQSLNNKELSICGRAHCSKKALEVLGDCRLWEMFRSIGVDIIYGLPGQTINTLDDTLSSLLSIPVIKHLSAYELTIAKDTPFGRHEKILPLSPEESVTQMYELIGKRCAERGMYQYEVSNYAADGFESIHNKAYWTHKPYIGLGASAHSYIHPKRWSNVADVDQYISALSTNTSNPAKTDVGAATCRPLPESMSSINNAVDFEETIGPPELSREIIFLGLRNISGIDEDDFAARTGLNLCADGRQVRLQGYIDAGFLKKSGQRWAPTSRGMLFADMMSRELC